MNEAHRARGPHPLVAGLAVVAAVVLALFLFIALSTGDWPVAVMDGVLLGALALWWFDAVNT